MDERIKAGIEDYTNCIFINQPLVYFDSGHGDGQNYVR